MRIRKEKIDSLNQRFKKKKYFSILLALFTLGVNIFAWFAFSANAGLQLDGTVAAWDVEFKDENDIITRDVLVEVEMKPGMDDFNKTIEIETNSGVESTFSYEIVSFELMGTTIDVTSKADPYGYLRSFYPFSIVPSASKTTLSREDNITFEINVTWPYDETTTSYYAQDEIYRYNSSFLYYTKSGSTYTKASIANESAYTSQKSSLYLEKDDADSYFGMMCGTYEDTTGKPCLSLKMRLLVEQKNS